MLSAIQSMLPLADLSGLVATLPFWPLLGAAVVGLMLATRSLRQHADKAAVGGVAISLILSVVLWMGYKPEHKLGGEAAASAPAGTAAPHEGGASAAHGDGHAQADKGFTTHTVFHWISLGAPQAGQPTQFIDVNYFIDPLTIVMLLVVTGVGLMVVLYATGYMRDHHGHREVGYERFFAFLALFVFSMLMLVLAGNFALLYLGWELVGLCSYLLIGFYFAKPAAAAAAKKAFLVNRIGDFGFALGIFALYKFLSPHVQPGENPLDYATAFKYAGHLTHLVATPFGELSQGTVVALLLLCGALGKSAQFPLYVWLPDAMEGPTPVSALIHAATMVTAGVYMIARCGPIFAASPIALEAVALVGIIGAVLAATMAMAQYDMKRILAYSTMSQLAYMFVGLACAAPDASVFHLFTHAFFKALLFLCAGSVMHAMGGVIDLRHFSGLRRVLPKTYGLMLIGCLALAGFPLLAGFWSKDAIVHAAFYGDLAHDWPWLGWALIVTAFLTAYYTFRMFFLCFHGELRLPPEAGHHPHESPASMLGPLVPLAAGALLAGYVPVSAYLSGSSIQPGPHHAGGEWLYGLSAGVGLAGIALAWLRYGKAPVADPDAALLGPLWRLMHAKWYVDEIYQLVFVRPLRALGDLCFGVDRDGVDGVVGFVAGVPRGVGLVFRSLQRGALQGYALAMSLGVVVLLVVWKWLETSVG